MVRTGTEARLTEFARPSSGGAFSSPVAGASEVAVVGAGRVGCAMGRALSRGGHRIVAASVASPSSVSRVREALGEVPIAAPFDAALAADIVIVAVADDALSSVVAEVAGAIRPTAAVVHTSGLHGAAVLAPCGERVAAVHPAQSIPSSQTSLAGVWFGVTCSEAMRPWAEWFVAELGGVPLQVPEEDRIIYHAALAMASNFSVALAGDAEDLLHSREVLAPLLRQTVENVIALGADAALTGPVVRGDEGTVRAHLAALPPGLLESYVANARRALERAVRSGRLEATRAAAVAEALEEALVR